MSQYEELGAVSPIDGRYASKVTELQGITSEYGLIKYRLGAMATWYGHLQSGILPDVDPISGNAQNKLQEIVDNFGAPQAAEVKEIEKKTNHDVKAVENYLRQEVLGIPELAYNNELIHFGCTSEDVNNLAYAHMYRDARNRVIVPRLGDICGELENMSHQWAEQPLLSLTHGQPATPTTLGKEIRVFAGRLDRQTDNLETVPIAAKWNGATGNYAAATIAYPEVNWQAVNRIFIEAQGFDETAITTQIEPHDWLVRYLNELALANSIKLNLARDMWGYIQRGVFAQKVKAHETGSSTMPHKVNPIDWENAEANLGLANATSRHLADKLPISRFQRDLSDSSALRATGEIFGHTLIADQSILRGLGKININTAVMNRELNNNWAVLTEAVQTVLRRYEVPGAYEKIKAATRGTEFGPVDYYRLVEDLGIPEEAKQSLRVLTPRTYTGISSTLARS